MLKTLKFGGSSLATGKAFEQVKSIVDADSSRRILVVSAPGKRFSDDSKITDLLYLCHAHIKYGVNHDGIWKMIEDRYTEIANELNIDLDLEAEFQMIRSQLNSSIDEAYLVSRGEYLCGKLLAAYLGFDFVDALDVIALQFDGRVDQEKTYQQIQDAFESSSGSVVIPGFYGAMPNGHIRLMTRGGSDISGALVAAALNCSVYENWTDVSGILMADPSIVENPRPIYQITYDELQELTYMGAKVLHKDALFPVREKGIPLNIRNTWKPEDPGTIILDEFEETDENGEGQSFITGLAGRRDYSVITIHGYHTGNKSRMLRRIIEVFEKYNISIEHMPFGISALSIVVPTEVVKPNIYSIIADIERFSGDGNVTVDDGISVIAVVGRKMIRRPGTSARLFAALGDNDISLRLISQGLEEINILIGVDDEDFEQSMRVLYESFTRKEN